MTVWGNDLFTYTIQTIPAIGTDLAGQTLASFKIAADIDQSSADSIELQVYTKEGGYAGRYYFFNTLFATVFGDGADCVGWYDADHFDDDATPGEQVFCNDSVIPYGCSVMLMNAEDDIEMTYAGEVLQEDKAYTVWGNDLFTYSGNSSPVARKLGDFTIPEDADQSSADSIELQIYTKEGGYAGRYYFFNTLFATVFGDGADYVGWYDADHFDDDATPGEQVCCNETVTIEAGRSFMLMNAEDDLELTVPAAIKPSEE